MPQEAPTVTPTCILLAVSNGLGFFAPARPQLTFFQFAPRPGFLDLPLSYQKHRSGSKCPTFLQNVSITPKTQKHLHAHVSACQSFKPIEITENRFKIAWRSFKNHLKKELKSSKTHTNSVQNDPQKHMSFDVRSHRPLSSWPAAPVIRLQSLWRIKPLVFLGKKTEVFSGVI